jgi:hypothetical protein
VPIPDDLAFEQVRVAWCVDTTPDTGHRTPDDRRPTTADSELAGDLGASDDGDVW